MTEGRFFHSGVIYSELSFLLPGLPKPLSTNEKKTSNCPLCNLKGEIQVTGEVINPYYRSSLIFLMNILKTFTTSWRGRK